MSWRTRRPRLASFGLLLSLAATGCDDLVPDLPDGSHQPGDGDGDTGDGDTGDGDTGDGDTGDGDDAGADAGHAASEFMIPAGGGSTQLTGASGATITFAFPASAAGTKVTLTPTTAGAIGWGTSAFSDVIRMEPDGLAFSPAVRISVSNGALFVLDFPSSETQSSPEPLPLAEDGSALLLSHFSTLAVVAPDQACESSSGWQDSADSERCTSAAASVFRSFACKNYRFCHVVEAHCCVAPNTTEVGCRLGDANLSLAYVPTASNGGQYPYCDATDMDASVGTDASAQEDAGTVGSDASANVDASAVEDASSGSLDASTELDASVGEPDASTSEPDSGATADASVSSCAGQDPHVTSISPSTIKANAGDQVITLHGTCFAQGGTVFTGWDSAIQTSWISETEVQGIVPAPYDAGSVNGVGYANAAQQGGYDWGNASNVSTLTVVLQDTTCPFAPQGGSCYASGNGCECSHYVNSPAQVYTHYTMTCSGGSCQCKQRPTTGQVVSNYGTAFSYGGGCGSQQQQDAMHAQWITSCCPVP
jgi:hypothetical protein